MSFPTNKQSRRPGGTKMGKIQQHESFRGFVSGHQRSDFPELMGDLKCVNLIVADYFISGQTWRVQLIKFEIVIKRLTTEETVIA